jgi:hypothetical protein
MTEIGEVAAAERGERALDQPDAVLDREFPVQGLSQRDVKVIGMELAHAEYPFLERRIAVQQVEVLMRAPDRRVVDGERDMVGIEGHLLHRVVMTCLGQELAGLDGALVKAREGAAQGKIGRKELGEGILPHPAVRRAQELHVAAFGKRRELSVLSEGVREFHVGVGERRIGVLRLRAELSREREEGFLFRGQDMRLFPQELLKEILIFLQDVAHGAHAADLLLRQREKLRLDEGLGCLHGIEERQGPGIEPLILCVRGVGVRHHARIGEEGADLPVDLVTLREALKQVVGILQPSAVGGKLLQQLWHRLGAFFPVGLRGEDILEPPAVLCGNILSFRNLVHN